MAVTYTNRKGRTYYLQQGTTKTGKPRYYFSRDDKGNLVDEIPEGFEIRESVNGIVSLAKERPKKILPAEVKLVEDALKRHEKASDYRVNVKPNEIQIYERVGPNAEELISSLGLFNEAIQKRLEEERRTHSQFTPALKFILQDEQERNFNVKRMCHLGSIDDWIDIAYVGDLSNLLEKIIPVLGTDQFFELR